MRKKVDQTWAYVLTYTHVWFMLNAVFCFCSKNLSVLFFFSNKRLKQWEKKNNKDIKQFKLELWSLRTKCKIAFTFPVLTDRPGYYCRSTATALCCKST